MNTREVLADTLTPDGERLTLTLESGEHVVRVRGELLMSSRVQGSEEAMAQFALSGCANSPQAQVLIGGLGFGYTLRAALELLREDAQVQVLELIAEVVTWNRNLLGEYANHPLDDHRVELTIGDITDFLKRSDCVFDAILLDIDNGPEAFTVASNDYCYSASGLNQLFDAVAVGGRLVLWSSFKSPKFEKQLRAAGFDVSCESVRARSGVSKGRRHFLFIASRPPGR